MQAKLSLYHVDDNCLIFYLFPQTPSAKLEDALVSTKRHSMDEGPVLDRWLRRESKSKLATGENHLHWKCE